MHRGSEGVIMVTGKGPCHNGGGGRNARMTPLPVRWGALAALVSGMLWIVGGLLHLAYPQDPPGALGHFLNSLGTAVFRGADPGMLGGLGGRPARPARRAGSLLDLPRARRIQWRLPWHAGRAGGTPCPSSGTLRKARNSGV